MAIKKKKQVRFKHYSASTFGIPCPRALRMKTKKEKIERLPSQAGKKGHGIHNLIEEAIELNDWGEVEKELGNVSKLRNFIESDSGDVMIEPKIEYLIEDSKIKGFADIVILHSDRVDIIDIKTTRWGLYQERKDFELQLMVYAYNYVMQGLYTNTYTFYSAINDLRLTAQYSPIDQVIMEKRIQKQIKKTNELLKKKEPIISWYCEYCPYLLSCPLYKQQDKKALAQNILLMEAKLRESKKLLRAMLKGEKLEVGGQVFQEIPVLEYMIDKGQLFDFLQSNGEYPLVYFSITKATIDKLVKKYGEVITNSVEVKQKSLRFGHKKKEE